MYGANTPIVQKDQYGLFVFLAPVAVPVVLSVESAIVNTIGAIVLLAAVNSLGDMPGGGGGGGGGNGNNDNSGDDECDDDDCKIHLNKCLETRLASFKGDNKKSRRCDQCFKKCQAAGGNWPEKIYSGSKGKPRHCDYWNYRWFSWR